MPKRTRKYEESRLEDLRDPVEAAALLNVAMAGLDEPDGWPLFLMALRDVIRAQNLSEVAKSAELGRESLYKSLSASGNPKLKSILTILQVLGLRISFETTSTKDTPTKKRPKRTAIAKAG